MNTRVIHGIDTPDLPDRFFDGLENSRHIHNMSGWGRHVTF